MLKLVSEGVEFGTKFSVFETKASVFDPDDFINAIASEIVVAISIAFGLRLKIQVKTG